MFKVFGFYKFIKINNLKKLKNFFQKELIDYQVRGTIILSPEGINGTIAGLNKSVENIIKNLKSKIKFKEFDSFNISKSNFHPFHRGKVKIKKEVVPLGLKI